MHLKLLLLTAQSSAVTPHCTSEVVCAWWQDAKDNSKLCSVFPIVSAARQRCDLSTLLVPFFENGTTCLLCRQSGDKGKGFSVTGGVVGTRGRE